MTEFRTREFPLSVCIVDMDWHTTQTGNRSVGWTGYTWNRELFPDPEGLIGWLHGQGLRTALNLHPADGVHPHEDQYPAMAAALGIDPATGEPVEFDIADPRFAEAYFSLLHHPQEEMVHAETEFLEETRFLLATKLGFFPAASTSGGWTGSRASRRNWLGWTRSGGSITSISMTCGATA